MALLILGVLVSLAAPQLNATIGKHRIGAVRTELVAAIESARWEALRRNTRVSLLRRTDCSAYLSSDDQWDCGWVIVAGDGITRNSVVDAANVLQSFSLPAGIRVLHAGGGPAFQIAGSGYPLLVGNKFVIGKAAAGSSGVATDRQVTTLCMNRVGRIRQVEGQATC